MRGITMYNDINNYLHQTVVLQNLRILFLEILDPVSQNGLQLLC